MLRRAIAGLLVVGTLLLSGFTAQSGDKKAAPIKVSWYGQSFFVVESQKGYRVAFDPHMIAAFGRIQGVKADLVLISHNHDDHTQVEVLENHKDKKFRAIRGLKTLGLRADWNVVDEDVGPVHVRTVGLYHDDKEGLEAGKNSAFIVDMDGWRICHLGDLGHILTPAQVKQIGEVDVLMIPVGGVHSLNGTEAKQVMSQIKPREYVFPMHYGTKSFDDLLPVAEFLDGQPKNKVAETDDNQLTLNRETSRPRPLTVVFTFPVEEKKKKTIK
jgi:L-ascorbate metabolism protein UlaG (beta-lactamase superfamily)